MSNVLPVPIPAAERVCAYTETESVYVYKRNLRKAGDICTLFLGTWCALPVSCRTYL